MYIWRAVDGEGEVLDILVQPRRDKAAAPRLLRKLLRRQGFVPTVIVTDKLRSSEPRFVNLASRVRTSKDCAPTTPPRTRISQFEDENERCRASNQPNLCSASFPSMPRSTTHSMFNGI
jgi:transposase-like protein